MLVIHYYYSFFAHSLVHKIQEFSLNVQLPTRARTRPGAPWVSWHAGLGQLGAVTRGAVEEVLPAGPNRRPGVPPLYSPLR